MARGIKEERRQEIAELAEFIADDYFPTGAVNPLGIVNAKNITTSFEDYGDAFDGMLECRAGRFHIYSNARRLTSPDSPRARFTLGHELGHFFIPEHHNSLLRGVPAHPSVCEFSSEMLVEQEADLFASHLLLPQARFLKATRALPKGLPSILSVSATFGTSITATAIRYSQEDVVPCTVMKWSSADLEWKRFSPTTYRERYRKTIEAVSAVPEGSATARALANEPVPPSGFFQSASTAAFWFPFMQSGSSMNVILIEHAIPLGRFGVLTLLYPESGSYSR